MTVGFILGCTYEKASLQLPPYHVPVKLPWTDFLRLHKFLCHFTHIQNCEKSGQNFHLKEFVMEFVM